MFGNLESLDDCQLIARICAGDEYAWHILYARHHARLLIFIIAQLHDHPVRGVVAEDIAQEVWIALVRGNYRRLQRYTLGRSKFHTYLANIARGLIQQRRRSAGRRPERVLRLEGHDVPDPAADEGLVKAELAEYVEALTRQETRCLHENLMREQEPLTEPPISSGNERVLKHRMQRKLPDHFDFPERES